MSPINPAEMGDVWPAVQPGNLASDYGAAWLDPIGPCVIRSFQKVTAHYRVGKFGLDDTGGIHIGFRWVNDCGPLQTHDPKAMNFVSAKASNGVPLELFVEPYGFRPWTIGVRITVKGGFMRVGDVISVSFGDQSRGGPGFRMQTIAEQAFELKVSVDACATGHFNALDDVLCFPVVAGPPSAWRIVAPSLRRPGEAFSIGIRAEDLWGNVAEPGPLELSLVSGGGVIGLPEKLVFEKGRKSLRVASLHIEVEGTYCVSLADAGGKILTTSNMILIQNGSVAAYWGDLHGQSGETVGIGTLEEYLSFARDLAFLDVSGHQGNDFQITNAFWKRINEVTTTMNQDGHFVVFPGYEWSGNTPVGGDHNVFFRHPGRQIRRSSHAMLTDRSDAADDATTLDDLFAALRDEDCILWSHVGGRPADVSFAHDPKLKTAVEVHSNWGTFEWILTDSLALGHRVGVVANSDGHKGRPGAGPPGATEFGAYGGLTCFLAPELTRDALFECMRRRHHYGTSGSRIGLDVRAQFPNGADLYKRDPRFFDVAPDQAHFAMMGDIVATSANAISLTVNVQSPAPVERVDVLCGDRIVETFRTYSADALGNRVRVYWQGAEYRGRGRNTLWSGVISTIGAEIKACEPVNHWNHERELGLFADGSVRFEAVTSGNFAGVDLRVNTLAASLKIETNLVSGTVALSSLGLDDTILDAGGLDRLVRIRRLPDNLQEKTLARHLTVPLAPNGDSAIWVRVTTSDGHQAWSSPIYVFRN